MAERGAPLYSRKEVSNKRQRQGEEQQRRRIRTSSFKAQQHRVRNADAEVQQAFGGGLQPRDLGILGERPALPRSHDPWGRDGEHFSTAQLREISSLPAWRGSNLREVGLLEGGNAPIFVEEEQLLPHAWPTNQWNDNDLRSGWPFHSTEKGLLGRAPGARFVGSERAPTGHSGGKGGRLREFEQRNHRVESQPGEYGILGGAPARPLMEHGVSITEGAARFWEQGLLGKRPISEALPSLPRGRVLDQERWEWHRDHEPSLRASDVLLQSHVGRLYAEPERILGGGPGVLRDSHQERVVEERQIRFVGMPEMAFRAQSNGRSLRGTALHRGLLGRVPSVADLDAA